MKIWIHGNYLPKLLAIWIGNVRESTWDSPKCVGGQAIQNLFGQVSLIYALFHIICPNY
jgi:hypothetical protein